MKDMDRMISGLFTEIAIKDCLKELHNDANVDACESTCGYLLLENEQTVQVKIIITKNEKDFIGDFDLVKYRIIDK